MIIRNEEKKGKMYFLDRLRNLFRNQMMQVILIQLITGADKQT